MRKILVSLAAATAWLTGQPLLAQDLAEAVTSKREMVVTANPLATAAGEKILKLGGSATDAMIAVQTVLGLVEPQSSGLGGGAFVVYYDAATDSTITLDAREKAPAAASEDRFAGLNFFAAWQSGLSVGVPGVPRMMAHMHERYGRLPWQRLFVPAMALAQRGFALSKRTSDQVAGLLARNESCDDRLFFRDPVALDYFANSADCSAKPPGTLMRNRAYANTLKRLIREGADAFYHGPIAEAIAEAVQNDPNIAGDMTVDDLAAYQVIERPPVCIDYRGYAACGMGPPSSGGLAVGQMLGILEHFELAGRDPLSMEAIHWFTQAGRLAFADRNQYVGDSDFVPVPVLGLLNKTYLAERAALIGENDMGTAQPGTPPGVIALHAPDQRAKTSGTSHVSIVDRDGNALSMTTTIESSFGNGVMVHGFLLNNELTDFAFNPLDSNGVPRANRVQANKRPRSSMSPTIVFDSAGQVELVTGSPGGSRIISYTAQSIINHIDFGLDPQTGVNTPHYMNRNGSTDIEQPLAGITQDYDAEATAGALEALGHNVNIRALTSGLSVIQVTDDGFIGGADQRRDGTVGGR